MRAVFYPDFSGGNPYQRELKAHLEARGVSVALDGCHRSSHWTRRLFPLLMAISDHDGPDVLHLHWIHPFFDHENRARAILGGFRLVFELFVLKLLDVRVIWTIHNLFDHERHLPELAETVVRHATVRLVDGAIVHCDRAADAVVESYRLPTRTTRRIVTIPHGNYMESYPNEVGQEAARAALELDDDETVFLYFGRIRAYKNVPALVSAFSRLTQDDVRLLIVGNPSNEALAEDLIARCASDDRIRTVLEFVPASEVQCYLNAADVVVLPFTDVLSSGSALLAMSFGRPVVAPALGCVEAVLSDTLTYDPEAPDGLAAALERAVTTDLRTVGRRNQERAREFDWDTVATRTEAVYRGNGTTPLTGVYS